MSDLIRVLEDALAADPDDRAAHAAYADLLMERGGPRGEFIQVQLALEDRTLSREERHRLLSREADLLADHQRDWLGEFAPHLLDAEEVSEWRLRPEEIRRCHWARGWIDHIYLPRLDLPTARALSRCSAARLLRRLVIVDNRPEGDAQAEPGDGVQVGEANPALYPLRDAPFLPQLRLFQLGRRADFSNSSWHGGFTSGAGAVELIRSMTRLEELYLLSDDMDLGRLFELPSFGNLRLLQVNFRRDVWPLDVLAANPTLGQLTTLRLHSRGGCSAGEGGLLPREQVRAVLGSAHLTSLTHLHLHEADLGNQGCEDLVRSGILKRLKVLDLPRSRVGEEGARVLATCPDISKLELLSLDLTGAGRELLRRAGVQVW
jgi:uncharacterized protein (TIGR02996 family)